MAGHPLLRLPTHISSLIQEWVIVSSVKTYTYGKYLHLKPMQQWIVIFFTHAFDIPLSSVINVCPGKKYDGPWLNQLAAKRASRRTPISTAAVLDSPAANADEGSPPHRTLLPRAQL